MENCSLKRNSKKISKKMEIFVCQLCIIDYLFPQKVDMTPILNMTPPKQFSLFFFSFFKIEIEPNYSQFGTCKNFKGDTPETAMGIHNLAPLSRAKGVKLRKGVIL